MSRLLPLHFVVGLFVLSCWLAGAAEPAAIRRTIDASCYYRCFPDLVGYRNTSIQKAPAPSLAGRAAQEFGKARLTRCWLNLDELWDYRTRQYTDNYQIGVHKYDEVPEKAVESWGWVTPTRVRFDDYLRAFGAHSDAVMLCVRRYERDILDKKLGVTFDDWKAAFKRAVKHSREICPNLRYIEVCNEYACFIRCTSKEYYEFYRRAYEAVNEANRELGLAGDDRLLVGGPNVVRDPIGAMNRFFEDFRNDPSPDKKLDFVTWHEYHNRYAETAHREKQVRAMLAHHALAAELPLFITEHDPYHPKGNAPEYNLINGAALVKSLYFTSVFSPGVKIMPWVLYHNGEIQTRFMWFEGPNEPDTRAEALRMLPAGCSMKLLAKHKTWEIAVDNAIDGDEIVLASVGDDGLVVEAVNYGPPRDVSVRVENLSKLFPALGAGDVRVIEYLVDQDRSNCLTRPEHSGGIEQVGRHPLPAEGGAITLGRRSLPTHGLVLWEIAAPRSGAPLPPPKPRPKPPQSKRPAIDWASLLPGAAPTPGARIQRRGAAVQVHVDRGKGRPGVVFRPSGAAWDVTGLGYLEARVKNLGKRTLNVHLALDNPGADRTERRNCSIGSASVAPGKEEILRVTIRARPPDGLAVKFRGLRGTPGGFENRAGRGIDPANVVAISVYVYQPGAECDFEVSDFRSGVTAAFPLPENIDDLFPMIDRFGQYLHKDWPGKTRLEADLARRRDAETAELAARPGPQAWNRYGAWQGGPKLEATGRFRVAKWRDKWWFVDPEGRLFWSHGLVRVTWSCGYTPVTGREHLFAELPGHRSPLGVFYGRSTWAITGLYERGAETYNFSGANLLRKYGPSWDELYADLSHRRLRSWGLNTMANCSQPAIYLKRRTPYTATVYSLDSPADDGPGATGYVATIHDDGRVIEGTSGGWGQFPDVFDPSFKAVLLKEVAQHRGQAVGDPWCLGYFPGNELNWGRDESSLGRAVLASPENQPAKRVLVDDLKAKYGRIEPLNAAWKTDYASWGALLKSTAPPGEPQGRDDLAAFLAGVADAYFRQCREAVKQIDPEGLYLGCRFAGSSHPAVFRAAAQYSDVVSLNRYSETLTELRLPEGIDKPVLIGEFHFGALDRGKFHPSLREVADQSARGAAYEAYVTSALENPLVVGTHWHQFGDQATTGRDDGENFQNGFVDVCDTPYAETIEACRRVGHRLYEIRAGQ